MMAITVTHIPHAFHVAVSKHFPKNKRNTTLIRGKFNFSHLKMRQKFVPSHTSTGKRIQQSLLPIFSLYLWIYINLLGNIFKKKLCPTAMVIAQKSSRGNTDP